MEKRDILTLSSEELKNFMEANGEKSFKSRQIGEWLWKKGVRDFDEMKNLSLDLRRKLNENFYFGSLQLNNLQKSSDGTFKMLWQLHDGMKIESALIPGKEGKYTVCISSQVGCSLGCRFCATGGMGFSRNLSCGEIFDQVVKAGEYAAENGGTLSNIVFMGMGEPLLNYENLVGAIRKITDKDGMSMSPQRITVSTAGIPQGIIRLADEGLNIHLAVSIHSAVQESRARLMPIARRYPLKELAGSIKYFVNKTGIRPTFEYLLLKDINDSLDSAKALAKFCRQFPVKINIIEYNTTGSRDLQHCPEKNKKTFIDFLKSCNMVVNIRQSKGGDIDAACGQLAAKKSLRTKDKNL